MPEGKHSDLPRSRTKICQQVLPRTLFHLVYVFVVFRGLSLDPKNDGQNWIIAADQT
jgi:hypothetical protein